MSLIKTLQKETKAGTYVAEIMHEDVGLYINYYSPTGSLIKKEQFPGKSIHYVEDAAVNWIEGIKVLNE